MVRFFIGEPLSCQCRPFESMSDDNVVEKGTKMLTRVRYFIYQFFFQILYSGEIESVLPQRNVVDVPSLMSFSATISSSREAMTRVKGGGDGC